MYCARDINFTLCTHLNQIFLHDHSNITIFHLFCDSQEIGGTSFGRDNEHKQFMNPDCHSEREDGWSEGDSRHSREGPGK